jgi:hypothetical protein
MKSILALIALMAVLNFVSAAAQTNAPAVTPTNPDAPASNAVHQALLFRPPPVVSGNVLPIRVGGGSRGSSANDILVEVLVPDQIALTTQAKPSLYWYQSKNAITQCEITITEPNNPKPLLMLKAAQPTPAGIHAIRLSRFNVELKPKVIYRWSVAVIVDPENRSQDIIANGVIERTDLSSDLAGKLAQASDADKPALYADNGIWYDSLQAISDQIDLDPKNAALRKERSDLLNQIGLDGAKMDALLANQ